MMQYLYTKVSFIVQTSIFARIIAQAHIKEFFDRLLRSVVPNFELNNLDISSNIFFFINFFLAWFLGPIRRKSPSTPHYPICSEPSTINTARYKRKTCRHCKRTTKYVCDTCPPDQRGYIGLCPECFRSYHGH